MREDLVRLLALSAGIRFRPNGYTMFVSFGQIERLFEVVVEQCIEEAELSLFSSPTEWWMQARNTALRHCIEVLSNLKSDETTLKKLAFQADMPLSTLGYLDGDRRGMCKYVEISKFSKLIELFFGSCIDELNMSLFTEPSEQWMHERNEGIDHCIDQIQALIKREKHEHSQT